MNSSNLKKKSSVSIYDFNLASSVELELISFNKTYFKINMHICAKILNNHPCSINIAKKNFFLFPNTLFLKTPCISYRSSVP